LAGSQGWTGGIEVGGGGKDGASNVVYFNSIGPDNDVQKFPGRRKTFFSIVVFNCSSSSYSPTGNFRLLF
jgi:hypothetical protein